MSAGPSRHDGVQPAGHAKPEYRLSGGFPVSPMKRLEVSCEKTHSQRFQQLPEIVDARTIEFHSDNEGLRRGHTQGS